MANAPDSDGQPSQGTMARFLRRPMARAVLVLLVAGGMYLLWSQHPPQARIVVVNATSAVIQRVELVMSDETGRPLHEQIGELAPGTSWEHEIPSSSVVIDMLRYGTGSTMHEHESLGQALPGMATTLTVQAGGRVHQHRAAIEQP